MKLAKAWESNTHTHTHTQYELNKEIENKIEVICFGYNNKNYARDG